MITRTLRGLGALTALAALLLGWPAALLAMVGAVSEWLPDLSDPAGLLARPDAGGLFLLLVLALGWAAWAVWAAAVLVEAVAQIRGVPTPRLGGLFPQQTAAALITAIAVAFAAAPTAALAAPPAAPPAVSAAEAGPTDEAMPQATMDELRDYVVQPGDSLWDVADEQLDDAYRWTEIADASRAIVQPDGAHLDDPDVIRPGWTLNIPDVDGAGNEAATPIPQTSGPRSADRQGDGVTLPTTPLVPPPPAVGSGEQSGHSEGGGGAMTLPHTPLQPPQTDAPAEVGDPAQAIDPTSTPMAAGTVAATINDEGRSGPAHGVLGLPDWITYPLFPTRPEQAPDLLAC